MTAGSISVSHAPLFRYVLARADDALILGHRLSEWCGHAPMMEEDMALANMGLDLLGQARALYAYAAETEGAGRSEDDYAFLRDVSDYANLLLVEQPNGDFACTIARQYFYSAFIDLYWRALTRSSDATLAAIASKACKESAYHVRHCAEWMIRLGDGTPESHARAQEAVALLWTYTGEMFEVSGGERALITSGALPDLAALKQPWTTAVRAVLAEATLAAPGDVWMQTGGRSGRHSEHLGRLLADLQYMQRAYPGAKW